MRADAYVCMPLWASLTTVRLAPGNSRSADRGRMLTYVGTDPSIYIAMRSRFMPPQQSPSLGQSTSFDVDLDLQLDIAQQAASTSTSTGDIADDSSTADWEQWGEDSMIELCKVNCGYTGTVLSQHL